MVYTSWGPSVVSWFINPINYSYIGVSFKKKCIPKWLVYNGKSIYKWTITGGTPMTQEIPSSTQSWSRFSYPGLTWKTAWPFPAPRSFSRYFAGQISALGRCPPPCLSYWRSAWKGQTIWGRSWSFFCKGSVMFFFEGYVYRRFALSLFFHCTICSNTISYTQYFTSSYIYIYINGHFRNLNCRYLPHIRPI